MRDLSGGGDMNVRMDVDSGNRDRDRSVESGRESDRSRGPIRWSPNGAGVRRGFKQTLSGLIGPPGRALVATSRGLIGPAGFQSLITAGEDKREQAAPWPAVTGCGATTSAATTHSTPGGERANSIGFTGCRTGRLCLDGISLQPPGARMPSRGGLDNSSFGSWPVHLTREFPSRMSRRTYSYFPQIQ